MINLIKKLIAWIRPSFEGNDHKLSFRRITAFVYVLVDLYITMTGRIASVEMLHVHYSILLFILILVGIITTQNLMEMLPKFRGGKNE